MNVKFNYLYRDAANYKQYHFEVFSNKEGMPIQEIDVAIRNVLIEGGWFCANKWEMKDLHLYQWDNEIDHNWHEYDCVEITQEKVTTGDDITDFIQRIQQIKNE